MPAAKDLWTAVDGVFFHTSRADEYLICRDLDSIIGPTKYRLEV